jgi:DNA recombination protein RmuC
MAKVGRQLGSAVTAYNEAVGSFESRVVPQLRRIEEAGASSERSVELAGIEAAPRTLTASLAEPERGALPPLAELDPPLERPAPAAGDAGAASADEAQGASAAPPADRVIRAA